MADLSRNVRRVIPVVMFLAGYVRAQSSDDLTEASLETLMNMEVSSPARKEQKLSQTAGAVYVISQEDIRRSGLNSIPELLRMVPGLQVAQISASTWAVSCRGFDGRFSDKMLVLIDGRSIYNHLYSGVYWEQNVVPLDDIERIEIMRGPGATMWGANAVNGVINIITKPAHETQGFTVSAGSGNAEHGSVSARYGGSAGDTVSYRLDGESFDRGPFASPAGGQAHDRWDFAQGGGRLDWQTSRRDSLTVQGEVYRGADQQTVYPDYPITASGTPVPDAGRTSGECVRARWERRISDRSDLALQFSAGDEDRTEIFGHLDTRTLDFDLQHHVALSARHDLMWGVGFQIGRDEAGNVTQPSAYLSSVQFNPAAVTEPVADLFVQDQIALLPERLTLTLGTKIEHDNYTGFENQPSARLLWTLTPRQGLWTAVSHVRRAMAMSDRDLNITFPIDPSGGVEGVLRANPQLRPDSELAYEAGYRNQPARWVSLDLAAFFCHYQDLRTVDSGEPFIEPGPPAVLVEPLEFGTSAAGHTYGIELATNWNFTPRWRLTGNYSWFRYGLDRAAVPAGSTPLDPEGSAPAHQAQFRSQWDIGRKLTLDMGVYFVSALTGLGMPSYARTDAHLGWRVNGWTQISVSGQNLLDGRHLEFASNDYIVSSEPGRAAYAKVTWAF